MSRFERVYWPLCRGQVETAIITATSSKLTHAINTVLQYTAHIGACSVLHAATGSILAVCPTRTTQSCCRPPFMNSASRPWGSLPTRRRVGRSAGAAKPQVSSTVGAQPHQLLSWRFIYGGLVTTVLYCGASRQVRLDSLRVARGRGTPLCCAVAIPSVLPVLYTVYMEYRYRCTRFSTERGVV